MLKLVLDSYCMFMYASSVFHADDGVYMKDVAGRNECILCESGRIWAGAHKAFHIWPWEFEQVGHVFKSTAIQVVYGSSLAVVCNDWLYSFLCSV